MAQHKNDFKLDIRGYLKELGVFSVGNTFQTVHYDNIVHHRIETKWAFSSHWEAQVDIRSRLLNGYSVRHTPSYANQLDRDPGYLDLSTIWVDTHKAILYSTIDRLEASYYKGPFEAHLGRQRLNWSRTFVWSPNDLFNNYAYLDFDYEERPGTDALNLQYSWSYASSIQAAYQPAGRFEESVIAAIFRSTVGTYDIQTIAGTYYNRLALGSGWSGYIGGAGFKGEITWFHPWDMPLGTGNTLSSAIGLDYMLPSSLYLQTEFLYNGGYNRREDPATQLTRPPGADDLFISKTAFFGQASYPVNPLLNASFSAIVSPDRSIWIFIPQLSYSLTQNIDLLALSQLIKGHVFKSVLPTPNIFYFRLKWSY